MSVVRRGTQQICERYRPRRLNELYGNQAAVKSLYQMFKKSPQERQKCYLFAGNRGAGKTSISRILATGLNCQKGDTGDPCLQCDNCKQALKDNAVFINEINCSKFTTKEQIFKLSDQFNDFPFIGRNNIFILDEVQSLSTMSQNLLLKYFENPPANTYFFLCTTQPQKILPTIHDRSSQFLFRPPTKQDRIRLLTDVFNQQGWGDKLSKEQKITLINATANFSYRKILKTAQQVISGGIQALKDLLDIPLTSQGQKQFDVVRNIMDVAIYRPFAYNGIDANKLYSDSIEKIKNIEKFQAQGFRRIMLTSISNRILNKNKLDEIPKLHKVIQILQKPYYESDGCMAKFLMDLYYICLALKE